jgi:hypothetical protein
VLSLAFFKCNVSSGLCRLYYWASVTITWLVACFALFQGEIFLFFEMFQGKFLISKGLHVGGIVTQMEAE